jgi:hypothetical protein
MLALPLTGCVDKNVVPGPKAGDCYIADRIVNASPMIGASAVLKGKLVSAGCVPLLRALEAAKKAGVDTTGMLP